MMEKGSISQETELELLKLGQVVLRESKNGKNRSVRCGERDTGRTEKGLAGLLKLTPGVK